MLLIKDEGLQKKHRLHEAVVEVFNAPIARVVISLQDIRCPQLRSPK